MLFFKNYGILGQNARNLNYIGEYNDKFAKQLADSKLQTKEFLSKKGVAVSQSLLIIRDHQELEKADISSLELPFVIKPNAGYGGKGIIIFDSKDDNGNYLTNDHLIYSYKELIQHTSDILDGFYSLSGRRDKVMFEKKIELDHSIDLLGKYGLPDIRVIVFNSIPVIAMLRVPTANSRGKANLHAWACGVWIDLGSWKLTNITQFGKNTKSIPWIGDVRSIALPKWEEILKLAVKVQQITKVGYVGCDIVLDHEVWPLLLEMNVRPWLEVQVANKVPLLERLKKVENIKVQSVEKWVRLARDLFGGDIEEQIKNISWKKVLWNKEYISIVMEEKTHKLVAHIQANQSHSTIKREYLENTLWVDSKKVKNEMIRLKCQILWEWRIVRFLVRETTENACIGKDVLWGFLIDPYKYKDHEIPIDSTPQIVKKNLVIHKGYEDLLKKLDKKLIDIDKHLNILKLITPSNLQTEKLKFVNSAGTYVPQLQYHEFTLNLQEFQTEIQKVEIPDIPLSGIFLRKKNEILDKILFLQAFQKQNTKDLFRYSEKLYWEIIPENLKYAKSIIFKKPIIDSEEEFLTIDEIKQYIEKFNHIYSIKIWVKERELGSRFSMRGNELYVKHSALVWKREMRSVIAHEVEGHYLRKINGQRTWYQIFAQWTAHYLAIEEGIAIYNQSRFLTPNDTKYYGFMERYYFIDFAKNHSYPELVEEYKKFYSDNYELIFSYLVRMKRGMKQIDKDGLFVKDTVYLNGYLEVLDYLKHEWSLKELYFGKMNTSDLMEIKKSDLLPIKVDDLITPFFII